MAVSPSQYTSAPAFNSRATTNALSVGICAKPGHAAWLAHYKEMLHDPATKIARPRQVYAGPTERDFLEIEKR